MGYLQVFATLNSATMNILIYVFWDTCARNFLGNTQKYSKLCDLNITTVFPKMTTLPLLLAMSETHCF